MAESLGQILAGVMPRPFEPRCPKCGARLVVRVTVHPQVYVGGEVTMFPTPDVRVNTTGKLVETKAQIADDVEAIDDRDEIYCERFSFERRWEGTGPGCDFWTHPAELEVLLAQRLRKAGS
jgi:hypothetical protein